MAGLMQRLDRLEKMLEAQTGSGGNPYRGLPDDEFYALLVLLDEDGPAAADVSSVPEERYSAALERARYLLSDAAYDERIALNKRVMALCDATQC